jgi:hypothetical protein
MCLDVLRLKKNFWKKVLTKWNECVIIRVQKKEREFNYGLQQEIGTQVRRGQGLLWLLGKFRAHYPSMERPLVEKCSGNL